MASIAVNPALKSSDTATSIVDVPVDGSSWIARIKYDPQTFQLNVTTKRGDEYIHFMQYKPTIDQFIQSPSKGKFYNDVIRGKGLSTTLITKAIGKPIRNPGKGPVIQKARRTHGR